MIAREGLRHGKALLRPVLLLDVVEVARVVVAGQLRHDRRHALPQILEAPVVVLEETVPLDLVDAVTAEALLAIYEKTADQALGRVRDVQFLGEVEGIAVVHDFGVGADEGVGVEGRVADEHLVEKDADGPPVAVAAVDALATLGLQDLRGYVVGRAHRCFRAHEAVLWGREFFFVFFCDWVRWLVRGLLV